MGSCGTKPLASGNPVATKNSPSHDTRHSKESIALAPSGEEKSKTSIASTSVPSFQTSHQKVDGNKHGGKQNSEEEECESTTATEDLSKGYTAKLKEDGGPPKRKLRIGYSSGGSSSSSEEKPYQQRITTSSGSHLADIKHSISVEGDLCKGVVHIETDFGRPIEEVYEGIHTGTILGTGVSGIVRQVKHRKTGVEYAAKCLDLGLIHGKQQIQALREEIVIMCQLDHPNIVRLEEVYESENEIFLIQELCTGGDLFDRLDDQSDFHYSEAKCARLVKQMLSAVRYLHSRNIIHRDLKLENFLFSTKDAESELRMIDFGFSKHFTHLGEIQSEPVGTPYTVAPEILQGQYDVKVDIWALGVITYLLLSGETPFGGCDGEPLAVVRARILAGQCDFEPSEIWEHVSELAKAFIRRLLDPDRSKRPTAKEAQRDPWLLEFGKKGRENGNSLSPNLCQALVEFKEYSNMRKFLCEILSFTLLPEQIAGLREEFLKVDTEGEGEISFSALKQVLKNSAEEGSLGALTENEVEEIFNALRVQKKEPKIRWHEFIAAGLSQCSFDERNLRLAFDRLDYDRKGFITLNDMKDLLGTTEDEDDAELQQMWDDGLEECTCPLGRITFDDFRMFIKGQKKETESMPTSPGRRRSSVRLSFDAGPLQAVPEGSVSPQPKFSVFAKYEQLAGLESLQLPLMQGSAGVALQERDVDININYPGERSAVPSLPPRPYYQKKRSLSEGNEPQADIISSGSQSVLNPRKSLRLPGIAVSELQRVISDESRSSHEVHKALYRKHREFRHSVMEASKLFDQKQKARKLKIAENQWPEPLATQSNIRASLVLKRGMPNSRQMLSGVSDHCIRTGLSERNMISSFSLREAVRPALAAASSSSDNLLLSPEGDNSVQVAEASKRSGRPRRPRQKTASDLSGMMK